MVDAFEILTQTCHDHEPRSSTPKCFFVRSCDVGSPQQSVLAARARARGGLSCLFTDIHDCLHSTALSMQSSLVPDRTALDDTAGHAFAELDAWMVGNCHWAVPPNHGAWCLVHKRICPMHPGFVFDAWANGSFHIASMMTTSDSSTSPSLCESSCHQCDNQFVPWWLKPSMFQMHDSAGPKPLIVSASGLTCTDFTPLGAQRGDSGPSNLEHITWKSARLSLAKRALEAIWFAETGSLYKAKSKQASLSTHHHLVSVLTGPNHQGYATVRNRSLSAGINKEKFVWVGPPEEEVQLTFDAIFCRNRCIDGRVYLMASEDEVRTFAISCATSRKKMLPAATNPSSYFCTISPPHCVQLKSEYERSFASKGIPPPHFADLDHHAGFGPKHGNMVPPLDTHPKTFTWHAPGDGHMNCERYLTPRELLASLGVDAYEAISGGRNLSPLLTALESQPLAKQLQMIGNGVHLPSIAAWFLFVVGNCIPVESINALPRGLSQPAVEAVDPDDDDIC